MDENDIKTLRKAILSEVESEKFYKSAAHNAKDPDSAKAFLYLAEDEIKHQQMLNRIIKLLTEGTECSLEGLDLEATPSPAIFKVPESGKAEYGMEISVFHIAILMEKASMDYYRQAAHSTTLAPMRQLYEFLANWEMKHLDSMENVYDWLTEEWFERQGFSTS